MHDDLQLSMIAVKMCELYFLRQCYKRIMCKSIIVIVEKINEDIKASQLNFHCNDYVLFFLDNKENYFKTNQDS